MCTSADTKREKLLAGLAGEAGARRKSVQTDRHKPVKPWSLLLFSLSCSLSSPQGNSFLVMEILTATLATLQKQG